MPTLLAPALAGLGAALVLLPVALHLWSRRPARVVEVASLTLLAGAPPSQARRLSPSDWPLLLLRTAIVACAALAAGGLAWRGGALGREPVALVDPAVVGAARLADSLVAAGRPVRWLVPGLPRHEAATPAPAGPGTTPLWPLLLDAATTLPEADTLLVAATRSAAGLVGARPAVPVPVRWLDVAPVPATGAPADTVTLCVQREPGIGDGDVRRLEAAVAVAGEVTGQAVRVRTGGGCPHGVVRLVAADRAAGTLADGPFRLDPVLGEWRLPVAQLNDPGLADALIARLGLRARERAWQPVSASQAGPITTAAIAAPRRTRSLAFVPGLLALVLLGVERVVAGRAPASARRAGAVA